MAAFWRYPQKNLTQTKDSKALTPLEIMVQLGFPKHQAEKALAATGHHGLPLALDWLLAHTEDPTLDTVAQRRYVLYVCPTGSLAEQLLSFWVESKELGWNGAHNSIPHITLVSFFKAPDKLSSELVNVLESVIDQDECPNSVDFETYVSPNFMGLFVKEKNSEWLKSIATRYTNKLADMGITAEPQIESLHLTLAYQFPSNLFQSLRLMVGRLNLTTPVNWEFRLYSKDVRLENSHVHKVTRKRIPKEPNEMKLTVGDYIYVQGRECDVSENGWIEGISWLTGTSGRLRLNYTKRTAESDSWTLHTTIQITENKAKNVDEEATNIRKPPVLLSTDSIDTPDGIAGNSEPMEASQPSLVSSRQIFICRHGERVDFTFGAWIPYCFEANGCYVRKDLNMPKEIPRRDIRDFQNDSPLTTVGEVQAGLVGEAMKLSNIKIDVAFTSPSLRCIQTLTHILKGLDSDIPMKIEPGLIEWLAWYQNGIPVWMTLEELVEAGFNVDKNYNQFIKAKDLPLKENAAQYYERSYELIKRIIETTVGNILIVAHATSLAACTRQLTGGRVPPAAEVSKLVQRIPYLACLTAREGIDGWQLHPPPFPPITQASNSRFDWKVLM